MELISNHPKEQANRIFASVVEDDFAFELINELGKAFLRAEDRTAQVGIQFVNSNFNCRRIYLLAYLLGRAFSKKGLELIWKKSYVYTCWLAMHVCIWVPCH